MNLSGGIAPIDPGGTTQDDPPEQAEWPTTTEAGAPDGRDEEPKRADDDTTADFDPTDLRATIRELEATIEDQRELLAAQADAVDALAAVLEDDQ